MINLISLCFTHRQTFSCHCMCVTTWLWVVCRTCICVTLCIFLQVFIKTPVKSSDPTITTHLPECWSQARTGTPTHPQRLLWSPHNCSVWKERNTRPSLIQHRKLTEIGWPSKAVETFRHVGGEKQSLCLRAVNNEGSLLSSRLPKCS